MVADEVIFNWIRPNLFLSLYNLECLEKAGYLNSEVRMKSGLWTRSALKAQQMDHSLFLINFLKRFINNFLFLRTSQFDHLMSSLSICITSSLFTRWKLFIQKHLWRSRVTFRSTRNKSRILCNSNRFIRAVSAILTDFSRVYEFCRCVAHFPGSEAVSYSYTDVWFGSDIMR